MSIYGSIGFTRRSKEQPIKVNKQAEQKIRLEIKKLQDQRTEYYNDDNINDEELSILEKGINEKINQLIESMY